MSTTKMPNPEDVDEVTIEPIKNGYLMRFINPEDGEIITFHKCTFNGVIKALEQVFEATYVDTRKEPKPRTSKKRVAKNGSK